MKIKMNSNKAKLSKSLAFLAGMFSLIAVFSCSKDNGNTGGGGGGKHTLTITKPTNGTLVSKPEGIDCGSESNDCKAEFSKGTKVTLTAKSDTGYIPGDWQGACDKTAADQVCKLSMDANKTAGKAFLVKHTLSIDPKPKNGTLVSNPAGINCGSEGTTCEASFGKGTEVTLTAMGFSSGSTDLGHVPADWQGDCDKTKADQPCQLSIDANKTAGRLFIDIDVDDDNDGLIEVHNLDMFDHIQHDLAGTSYKTSSTATANTRGAPEEATDDCTMATAGVYLCGYELTKDLDFANGDSYAGGSVNADWRPNASDTDSATNAGFVGANNFAGLFDGNGYEISNLYSRHTASSRGNIGLFARTTTAAAIRNVGIVDAHLYGGAGNDNVGTLVGENRSSIDASYAKGGTPNSGGGLHENDNMGGLVGKHTGSITASHATVDLVNSSGGGGIAGGLVGNNDGGIISASYATGNVAGGNRSGGLVGENFDGSITASYATGNVDSQAEADNAGGLVGWNNSSIVASYATGNVNGNTNTDNVGGLVGYNHSSGSIGACYALGDADGGDDNDNVGTLVGENAGSITHSYAFGSKINGETDGSDGDAHPGGLMGMGKAKANTLTDPAGLETTDADDVWDDASEKTKDAWDFGTNSQPPALRYADYDDAGDTYSCDMFPAKIPGTDDDLICGTSLLPDQPGR